MLCAPETGLGDGVCRTYQVGPRPHKRPNRPGFDPFLFITLTTWTQQHSRQQHKQADTHWHGAIGDCHTAQQTEITQHPRARKYIPIMVTFIFAHQTHRQSSTYILPYRCPRSTASMFLTRMRQTITMVSFEIENRQLLIHEIGLSGYAPMSSSPRRFANMDRWVVRGIGQ